jgi:hypothetical protein
MNLVESDVTRSSKDGRFGGAVLPVEGNKRRVLDAKLRPQESEAMSDRVESLGGNH